MADEQGLDSGTLYSSTVMDMFSIFRWLIGNSVFSSSTRQKQRYDHCLPTKRTKYGLPWKEGEHIYATNHSVSHAE